MFQKFTVISARTGVNFKKIKPKIWKLETFEQELKYDCLKKFL